MPNEIPQKPKTSKRKFLIPLVLLVGAGIAVKVFYLTPEFVYAGTLEATKVDLSSRLSSSVEKVEVQEGDHVTQDQELIRLSCDDIKVAADLANLNFARDNRLSRAGTVSQETLDQVKNRKDDADVRMGWCTIRAPIPGTILGRYHEPGELVTPGTKLLTLANIRDIWAYIYVPQPEVSRLKPGMTLQARLPEMPGKNYTGKILKINDEAEFTPKNVQTQAERSRLVFGVKVSFLGANEDETLKPGMTIEISLPKD